ncbi:MAG: methyltransferase domain-containing protein [Pseudomonadota bacterium]
MSASPRASHWDDHAAQWNLLASPLRPHEDDVGNLRQALPNIGGLHFLLGVTPEYGKLIDRIIAIDHNAPMIRAVWLREVRGKSAVQADWLHLPFGDDSCDACIGDGSLNVFSYPSQYGLLFEQVRRVLRPGGQLALRVFVRPDAGETCETVCARAMRAASGNFHAFKWRLAMAIAAESGDSNVRVAEIRQVFMRLLPDRERLAAASGWPLEQIATIDAYKDAAASYSFPTLAQVRGSLPPEFEEIDLLYGSYELAQCCPMFVLRAQK